MFENQFFPGNIPIPKTLFSITAQSVIDLNSKKPGVPVFKECANTFLLGKFLCIFQILNLFADSLFVFTYYLF
jgi:hypothetical protein